MLVSGSVSGFCVTTGAVPSDLHQMQFLQTVLSGKRAITLTVQLKITTIREILSSFKWREQLFKKLELKYLEKIVTALQLQNDHLHRHGKSQIQHSFQMKDRLTYLTKTQIKTQNIHY